jgi:sarcosine oxidase delta subunit
MINLLDIRSGFTGLDPVSAEYCYVACMVCLHRNKHSNQVQLDLQGDINTQITLQWEDFFDEQIDRTWQDYEYATEHGAICISVMLVKEFTDYTIIERSRKGTGFDYWLGYESIIPFQNAARLEISGIFKETEQNNLEKRFQEKKKQTNQSDNSRLPAYISIIEFSKPRAIFAKK